MRDGPARIGFVVKRYPRYSETFIVREILAHEAAGVAIEIYSLQPSEDSHYQELIARVRAPVNHLFAPPGELREELETRRGPISVSNVTLDDFWFAVEKAAEVIPDIWQRLEFGRQEGAREVYQALLLARDVRLKQICHLHAPFAHTVATVARLASKFAGITYSITLRAKDIFHESVQTDELTRKIRDAAAAFTVTDYNREYLRTRFGEAADRVQRVYNGLDLRQFTYECPRDRPPVILAVGRLVEKKGFPDLIAACGLLAAAGTDFRCRIIGVGTLRPKLQDQIDALGLADRVELVGARPQMDVIEEMRRSAVFCLPCIIASDGDRDGLPNVLFEAMSLGAPCVSTDVVGIPELVRNDDTGLLVPQRDPEALAHALGALLGDADLRVGLAERARRLIEEEFDAHRNAARRREWYLGLRSWDDDARERAA